MWRHAKYLNPTFNLIVILSVLSSFSINQMANAQEAAPEAKISFALQQTCEITVTPKGKSYKHKPLNAVIYQLDQSPLGRRTPLLIVHGLRAEYYPLSRWGKVIKRLNANSEFASKYKIYLARYNSLDLLDNNVPLMQEQIAKLYEAVGKKQIVVLALSIGGNLIYESMLKPETDSQIKMLLAMGSPFHGSPLFCADWLKYSIYKNLAFPWTRLDHNIAYKLYFDRNPSLIKDFCWDNCDGAIPVIGHFASKLPLGPKGNLLPATSVNDRMVAINKRNFDKSKLITYSGYLINPYQLPERKRVIESAFMFPYTLMTIDLPVYLAREHAVLKWLNRIIATVVTTESTAKRSQTNFVYALNDGITPIISSMFLPDRNCILEGLAREADIKKLKPLSDVSKARIFRNVNHLTFLDCKRPFMAANTMRDELNPNAGVRDIFDWILLDLGNVNPQNVAEKTQDT